MAEISVMRPLASTEIFGSWTSDCAVRIEARVRASERFAEPSNDPEAAASPVTATVRGAASLSACRA